MLPAIPLHAGWLTRMWTYLCVSPLPKPLSNPPSPLNPGLGHGYRFAASCRCGHCQDECGHKVITPLCFQQIAQRLRFKPRANGVPPEAVEAERAATRDRQRRARAAAKQARAAVTHGDCHGPPIPSHPIPYLRTVRLTTNLNKPVVWQGVHSGRHIAGGPGPAVEARPAVRTSRSPVGRQFRQLRRFRRFLGEGPANRRPSRRNPHHPARAARPTRHARPGRLGQTLRQARPMIGNFVDDAHAEHRTVWHSPWEEA